MSFGPQPWQHGPPHPGEPTALAHPAAEHERQDAEEAARLAVGLRLGLRIAAVWLLWVLPAAVAPGVYGTPVAGPVSLGVLLAAVPLAVGVHALVAYGRRVDRIGPRSGARRWP
ncbi:hypothetical protein ACF052_01220 [Streptomyces pilosus]|uniref:hypothetical protein n=1 Tax=Streptomyces pilosus TaxID=28893 RepID=UPI0037006601